MQELAHNLWIKTYPLHVLGENHGRVVTLIRLNSGELIIHSTAPFTTEDVAKIKSLGRPTWLVEAMLLHDTYSREGQESFPFIPYLAPEGFSDLVHLPTRPLLPAPSAWKGQVEVLLIDGMPKILEHVFLHVSSKTLIVGDLVFHFEPATGWTKFFRRYLMGLTRNPDLSRLYPLCIKDRAAFNRSIQTLLSWDFDRIIVGHQLVVETGGKKKLREALEGKGLL